MQIVYNENIKQVKRVVFSTLGESEIKNRSVFDKKSRGVIITDLYDNGEPKKNSLIDTNMGATNKDHNCAKCGFETKYCPGHEGHVTLAFPMYNIIYFDFVVKLLKCFCLNCSKLVKYNANIASIMKNVKNEHKISKYIDLTKTEKNCYYCNSPLAKIKPEKKKLQINAEYTNVGPDGKPVITKEELSNEKVYNVLTNTSPKNVTFLGLDGDKINVKNFMFKTLPIPSVPIRPSGRGNASSSKSTEDALTISLIQIIRGNEKIFKSMESLNETNKKYFLESIKMLQLYVGVYIDNDTVKLPPMEQNNTPLSSLTKRLKGKKGRIRDNLMGKRTNFSARTVITPDPTLKINEIGVPIAIAKNITFPEIVSPENIERLKEYVKNGKYVYPGANYVIKQNMINLSKPQIIDVKTISNIELNYGDIVERHTIDGDIILFNRQPTLHKQSMMGHYAKIIDNPIYNTFRMNPNVCPPYNGDFDGDEMNGFFPECIVTKIELEELVDVKFQIISPQSSSPIISTIQDTILGNYIMTNGNDKIDWRTAMNILSAVSINKLNIEKKQEYTGKELFSTILPETMNKSARNDDAGITTKIINGNLLDGSVGSSLIGNKKKDNLIHIVYDEYGPDKVVEFIDDLSKIANNYNMYKGVSLHIGDLYMSNEDKQQIYQTVETVKLKIAHKITEYENNPELMDSDIFEIQIKQELDNVSPNISKFVYKNLEGKENNLKDLFGSGIKPYLKTLQLTGCIGQQDYLGERIPKSFNNRTCIYFFQNDDTALARGFVSSSYMKGLNVPEFLFLHLTAREGVIDTAIKTAETGYLQKKMIKATEDDMVKYDGTVRNASNRIQQFVYGDSGIDTTKQFIYNINFLKLSNEEIKNNYTLTNKELTNNFTQKDNEKLYKTIIDMRDDLRNISLITSNNFTVLDTAVLLGVNLVRIFNTAKNSEKLKGDKLTDPIYILDKIHYILKSDVTCVLAMSKEEINDINSVKNIDNDIIKTMFKYALYDIISPKKCFVNNLSKIQFDEICENIIKSFNKSVADCGEMVGIIAGQSMGECTTQLTLKSFHNAGIGGKGASSLGAGRIREVLGVSKNIKEPVMVIYFDDKFKRNKKYVNKIAAHIKSTAIIDIRDNIEIYYNPDPTDFAKKDNCYNIFHTLNVTKTSCQRNIDNLPWLIRIQLNKDKMLTNEISLLDIKTSLCVAWEKRYKDIKNIKREKKQLYDKISQIAVISNSENDDVPMIHVRFDAIDYNLDTLRDFMDIYIDDFKLKGITHIKGIKGNRAFEERSINFDKENGSIITENEYIVSTDGININAINNIIGVDFRKTYCNDLITMYELYGIEATRTLIINELTTILLETGNVVNQHIAIFADTMTNMGMLTSIDRHGLNKLDNDPLSKASFEKTVEQLSTASIYNKTDTVESVSSRIILGLCIKGGTGACDLIMDKELLKNSEYIYDYEQTNDKSFNNINPLNKQEIDEDVFIPDL